MESDEVVTKRLKVIAVTGERLASMPVERRVLQEQSEDRHERLSDWML
jgi:hypothetical protein